MENEYPAYFASLSLEEIALMIKARFPAWSAFSSDSSVPDDWLVDDQDETVWIHELYICVHSLSPDQQKYLFEFLDHLKIA